MNNLLQTAVGLLLLCALALCGCTPRNKNNFARQLAGADRVIVTETYHGSMLKLQGQEAAELIQAVCSAEGQPKDVSAKTAPCCQIQFLRGTNVLAKILVQDKWIGSEAGEFLDNSGMLKALQRRLECDPVAWQAWVHHLAQDLVHRPEFTNLQPWSVAALKRYDLGELRTKEKWGRKELDYHELPGWLEGAVRAERLFAPEVYVQESQSGRGACIELSWDNQYGLLVGRSNYTTKVQPWYITNVAPGIYVFHDRE